MRIVNYLKRINLSADGPRIAASSLDDDGKILLLRKLHRAHLLAVPFENLTIFSEDEDLVVDLDVVYDKVVNRRRGGLCYELNYLFHWLLCELGFKAELISAVVASSLLNPGTKGFRKPPSHMLIRVFINNHQWLADVGCGNSFPDLLCTEDLSVIDQGNGFHKLVCLTDQLVEELDPGLAAYTHLPSYLWYYKPYGPDAEFFCQYCLFLTMVEASSFQPWAEWHSTDPRSPFMKGRFITMLQSGQDGRFRRVSLSGSKLILTENDMQKVQKVRSDEEYLKLLLENFGIGSHDISYVPGGTIIPVPDFPV